jgi:hypothetical protein
MGRAIVNTPKPVDISESPRQTQNNFSEQQSALEIGPKTTTAAAGDAISTATPAPSQINRWQVITTADEGLKNALYDWINTKSDGVRVAPDTTNGRTKKLTFNFCGNLGKSIKPDEIGEFNLIFSYPPKITQSSVSSNQQTNTN